MPKSVKDLVLECRKYGTTNGACVGYHNTLFDEVADRLEWLARREEMIKAAAYRELFEEFVNNSYTNIFPNSYVMPKNIYSALKKKYLPCDDVGLEDKDLYFKDKTAQL